MIAVVGGLELEEHQVAGSDGCGEEEDLHRRVIQGDEVGEEVQVAREEDQREQRLGATWIENIIIARREGEGRS